MNRITTPDKQPLSVSPDHVRGRDYWRSLEELADSEEFRELLRSKSTHTSVLDANAIDRREFLRLMGASLALAGLTACGQPTPPDEKIVPFVKQPENLIPGKPRFFATAFTHHGAATGVLVESHEGRPTKVEGNPLHPASLGATDAFAQASILSLYDPDRSQIVTNAGALSTWSAFAEALNGELEAQRLGGGAGLRILTETVISPTLADQLQALRARLPRATWHHYEPAGRDNARAGSRLAFGEYVETRYDFSKCDVILSLDADFLFHGPGNVRYAREFADKRRVRQGQASMNRLYMVESTPSVTGAMADHRLALGPSAIPLLARRIAARVGILRGVNAPATTASATDKWIEAVAADLELHRGTCLVVAGEGQPPVVHALAHAMNESLGNIGKTVVYSDAIESNPTDQLTSLQELAKAMDAGQVAVLIILGGNPVFTAPADTPFAKLLSRVGFAVHLSLYEDETSAACHWHVPESHYLETWSDARAYDGTATIVQPLIAPLYRSKSAHELLAAVAGQADRSGYEIVRDFWRRQKRAEEFEPFWRRALHDGVIAGSAFAPKTVKVKSNAFAEKADKTSIQGETKEAKTQAGNSLEIVFRPDPTIFDGRFANNGWLQELPKPLTKLTWDNAALISPATATRLGIQQRVAATGGEHGKVYTEIIELRYAGRALRMPAWIMPGHADDCATVYFGYGRSRAGKIGTGVGADVFRIRTSESPWSGGGLEIGKTGERYALACTQYHHNMEGRDPVRAATLEEYRKNPRFARGEEHSADAHASLYPEHPYPGHAWGMTIDTSACIGCNACVVACQAENNIPVVGKEEVTRGREMHWIRIDRYYTGAPDKPEAVHQPVPCMQCENAPCELVCPVNATNHSHEGLNDMVYNRCVGTRYCSNNCPYKVRRFNFFQYADFETASLKLQRNPNVTVRSRGVMEKCTYCVQRINAAKIAAEKTDRKLGDGEIVTACQAACPTQAIVFGDINDAASHVAKLKADSLNYTLLEELNTRPRTTYLAKLKNPNPDLKTE
ncbi:MAG TPA: TAT-variant-translocated molybdopterin oxidoreductase [Candidatus Binatia bacterium]|nr:TAT-variant-translocated molybdopterin oxidoreductase [Candidatus Binatia bacterium]